MSPWLLEADVVSQGLVLRGAPPPWVIWLVIVPGLVGFAFLFYRMSRDVRPAMRFGLAALRTIVLLLVAFLLMDPAFETLVVERKPTITVLLTDVSASMAHADNYSSNPVLGDAVRAAAGIPAETPLDAVPRLELLAKTLEPATGSVLEPLLKEKRLRMFSFGERVEPVAELKSLEAKDRETGIGRALERILDEPEVKGTTLGGIVIASDGRNTAGVSPLEIADIAARRKIPVHTITVGDPDALKDVELVAAVAPEVALVEDKVAIELKVRHRGYPGQRIEIRLLDGQNPLVRQQETLLPTSDEQEFRIFYAPVRAGQQQWIAEVRPLAGEHSTDNNRKIIDINVKNERIRVLYVETYPRWEYRNLKNFLVRGEEAFLAQCYLLEADRGFAQERTDGLEPLLRLPQTAEEVEAYDVIIFGDVDPDQLAEGDLDRARAFMQLVKVFVKSGGGFAMIAGDRFAPRAYKDSAIGDILPIVIDPTEGSADGDPTDRGYKMRLTEVGKTHPIMQIADDPERNTPIIEGRSDPLALKDMYWFARVKKATPGALVLATHESARNSIGLYPLVVSGYFEDGPVLFFAFDETWRWYWGQGPYSHHRFWGNVVRYLARVKLLTGNKRFRLIANRSELQVGDQVRLTAYVKDRSLRPSEADEQAIEIVTPGRPERRELLKKVEPGKFEKTIVVTEPGDYRAWIPPEDSVSDEKLSPVSFRATVSDLERKEPVVDEATLKAIAAKTKGRSVTLPDARSLLSELGQGSVEIPRQRRFLHLRDAEHPWLRYLPALFLGLLGLEWLLRKRSRLL